MTGDDVVLSVVQVTTLFDAIAQRFPMSDDERAAWVEHCVIAELRGNIMQGARHFGYHWLQRFTDGTTNWGAKIVPVVETTAMAVLDADGAMGAWVSKYAMEFACARAKRSGMFAVAVRNSPDWMMMSYCTRQALKHDCIGLAFANGRPEVAPWGGTRGVYGMNPFSAAIPAGERWPILVDMSSSDSGGLALQRELIKGGLPLGRFFAADGSAVTDPGQWGTDNVNWGIAGGAQRMGGYRDLALTVMVDALAGALTGMMCAVDLGVPEPVVDGVRTPRGQLIIAFDIAHFTPVATFKSKIDRAIDQAKASPLEEGYNEILMPGERGFREEVARRERGVPFEASVWRDMIKWAAQVGVDADAVVAQPTQ